MSTLSVIGTLYNPRKKKISNCLRQASQIKLDAIDSDTIAHEKCLHAQNSLFGKKMKHAALLQSILLMTEIMPTKSYAKVDRQVLENIGCGSYTKNKNGKYEYSYEYLYSNIQELISEKKIIYLMLGMKEYCLVEGLEENFYSTHSTCLILIPRDTEYDAYYINSHGRDMVDTHHFVRRLTKRRTKTVTFNAPYELIFIDNLIGYWNTLKDFNNNQIKIKWDMTKTHTYYSTDLQAGDYYGVCYMFPQVIWHHMGEFYTKKKTIEMECGKMVINTGEELLKANQLSIFVKYAFTNFNKDYCTTFIKHINDEYTKSSDDPLQNTIAMSRTAFIKCILCSLVRYMKQI